MLVLTPEGDTIPFEARGSLVSQEGDDFICGVARDVSQRKARPEEVPATEREMASVGESGRGIRYFHAGSGRVRDDLERPDDQVLSTENPADRDEAVAV